MKILYFLLIAYVVSIQFIHAQTPITSVNVRTADGKNKEIPLYRGSYALVIGNSNYLYWDKLTGVKDDIEIVNRTLLSQGFNTEVVYDLKGSELLQKVGGFIREYGYVPDNRLLIYFAGHGDTQKSADGRERGYIVPVDAPQPRTDLKSFRQKAISMETIENWAIEIETKHALFVFDSCFSGKLVSRSDIKLPALIEESLTYPGRQFITSGAANQKVSDNSYFRRMFVTGINGDADYNGDGYVNATELAYFLKDRVSQYSERSQTPQYGTLNNPDLDRGDMVFRVPESRRQNNEAKAEAAWNTVEKNNPDALRAFIDNYPNTERGREAVAQLNRIEPLSATRGDSADGLELSNEKEASVIPGSAVSKQTVTRIRFQKGKTSGTVSGMIEKGMTRRFVVGTAANQTVYYSVTSGTGDVDVNIPGSEGSGAAETDRGGDVSILVTNNGKRTNFTLTVRIPAKTESRETTKPSPRQTEKSEQNTLRENNQTVNEKLKESAITVTDEQLEITIKNCELREKRLTCYLSVKNNGPDKNFNVSKYSSGPTIVDADGYETCCGEGRMTSGLLVTDVPVAGTLAFDVENTKASKIARLTLKYFIDGRERSVIIRNIFVKNLN